MDLGEKMIRQEKHLSVRLQETHTGDIRYLSEYYRENGRFPLFQQVLIETRTDCNNRCPFCPHAHNQKPLGVMTWSCYTRTVDQLVEIGYNGRVALMVSNEPLLEDRLRDMVVYARKASPRLFLDITTNGKLLTLAKVDELLGAGLDNVNINDYREDRDKRPMGLSENLEPIRAAYGNNPKVTFQYRRTDEQLPNYGGNIKQVTDGTGLGFCNFPFRKVVVSYSGDVLLCCNDFLYNTCFGNVMSGQIDECWNHPRMNEIRIGLLAGRRMSLCARCNDSQDYNVFG